LLLAACGGPPREEAAEAVKTLVVAPPATKLRAAGEVRARWSHHGLRVGGRVLRRLVDAGATVIRARCWRCWIGHMRCASAAGAEVRLHVPSSTWRGPTWRVSRSTREELHQPGGTGPSLTSLSRANRKSPRPAPVGIAANQSDYARQGAPATASSQL